MEFFGASTFLTLMICVLVLQRFASFKSPGCARESAKFSKRAIAQSVCQWVSFFHCDILQNNRISPLHCKGETVVGVFATCARSS